VKITARPFWRYGIAADFCAKNFPTPNWSAGDLLLIEIHLERLNAFKRNNDFIITSESATVEFRRNKVFIAIAVAGVVLAASFNRFCADCRRAVVGAILLILFKCITLDEAYRRRLSGKLFFCSREFYLWASRSNKPARRG
jgi:hypothetical protein